MKKLKCSICGSEFLTIFGLQKHYDKVHNNKHGKGVK
jgi:hypothetical protein